jgi:hypothetical protein
MTETFYPKDIENYERKFNIHDFLPNKYKINEYDKIKSLAETQFINKNKLYYADCQSIRFKRIQIDCFGHIYPCYLFLEKSNGKEWDYNYANVIGMKYSCCKYCEHFIHKYCIDKKLDYII